MEIAAPWILSVIGSLWIGSYFSPYLRKRAENLATHDDLDKLVAQMRATTEATKAIEARIGDQVWNQQRQWEIKRDTLFEGCRVMAEFNRALFKLNILYSQVKEGEAEAYQRAFLQYESEALNALNDASTNFERARLLISIVTGDEVRRALENMDTILKKLSSQVVNGGKTSYATLVPLIRGAEKIVIDAVRKELGIKESQADSKLQSSKSSADISSTDV